MNGKKWYIVTAVSGIMILGVFPAFVFAATLNLTTDKTQFVIGDTFNVDIKINSENAGINAAQATLQFPKDIVQVMTVEKTNSVFDFWLQDPSFDNTSGTVVFIGGSTSGVSGQTLQVLRISFKVIGSGDANLALTDGAITASDGSGTNVLSLMRGLTITSITEQQASRIPAPNIPPAPAAIPPVKQIKRPAIPTGKPPVQPTITVPLYPRPDGWYNAVSNFLVEWDLPKDVTDIATAVNKDPLFDPTISEGLFDNKTFLALTDGVWNLHVRFKNNIGWGPTMHYKIGIDTAPPLAFTITVKEGLNTTTIAPTILYQTNDQPSGVAMYKITVDKTPAITTTATTYTLPAQDSGDHTIVVEADDLAGNSTSTRIKLHIQEHSFLVIGGFSITQFWFFVIIIGILLLGFAVGWGSNHIWFKQTQRKKIIAERDINNIFTSIIQDIDNITKSFTDAPIDERTKSETKFLLSKIRGEAQKAQEYIIEGIEEITK